MLYNSFENVRITGEEGGALSFDGLDHVPLFVQSNTFSGLTTTSSAGVGVLSFLNFRSTQNTLVSANRFQDCHAPIAGAIHWNEHKPTLQENTFLNVSASLYGNILGSYPAYVAIIDEALYL